MANSPASEDDGLHDQQGGHPYSRPGDSRHRVPQVLSPVLGLPLNQLNHRGHCGCRDKHRRREQRGLSDFPSVRCEGKVHQRHERQEHQKMNILVRKVQQLRLFLNEHRVEIREAQESHRRGIQPDNHPENYMYLNIHPFAFVLTFCL